MVKGSLCSEAVPKSAYFGTETAENTFEIPVNDLAVKWRSNEQGILGFDRMG